ncbi:hypothetical protein CC78DRAFT_565290 [Lojkania enalia]|uniref:peptidylprolyl isomerase n=1 Tax=Lojkania enalia TaxID=147567 RepID=A0A9P4KGS8_9PLEO|nr:hypothetical protein CC78DRAFT_565290 [Didymosphaeria enalia]
MRPFSTLFILPLTLLVPLISAQLGIEVTKPVDCTRKTETGDTISVHYRGTLQSDGTEFDSSYKHGPPFEFKLGAGQVIEGWDKGLLGMCIGEGRKLTVPPSLGYGNNQNGVIPAGSTLVFETELVGIEGVERERPTIGKPGLEGPGRPTIAEEHVPSRPTIAKPGESNKEEEKVEVSKPTPSPTPTPHPTPSPSPSPLASALVAEKPVTSAAVAAEPAKTTAAQASPMEEQDNGECHLLGPYALLVQGALGLLAVSSLIFKRWREHPRRPIKIWFFDVSKQVFGSALLHLANVLMSMLSSGTFDVAAKTKVQDEEGKQPNPCSFYLLNIAVDTTIGIPILVLLLKILHALASHTPLAHPPESIRSGNYGRPPRATWWLKQSIIYFIGLFGMKTCVFIIFQLLPWIAWVGDWALRWTEGNEAIQITFVMFVFPVIMNAVQYWIIDGFIKEKREEGYVGVGSEDEGDEEWLEGRRRGARGRDSREAERMGRRDNIEVVDEDSEDEPLKEANPTAVPWVFWCWVDGRVGNVIDLEAQSMTEFYPVQRTQIEERVLGLCDVRGGFGWNDLAMRRGEKRACCEVA